MSTQFDLEQQIMQCWNLTDDLEIVYNSMLNAGRWMETEDTANIILGMKNLYNLKFDTLFKTFEKFLKEKHESKVRDNSEVLRQTESVTISSY